MEYLQNQLSIKSVSAFAGRVNFIRYSEEALLNEKFVGSSVAKSAPETDLFINDTFSYANFALTFARAQSIYSVQKTLREAIASLGLQHFGLTVTSPQLSGIVDCHYVGSEDTRWIEFYLQHLQFSDPFTNHCIEHALPVAWGRSRKTESALREVSPGMLDALSQFNVRHLLVFPYRGLRGRLGGFRLQQKSLGQRASEQLFPILFLLGNYAFHAIERILDEQIIKSREKLTEKEKQVLALYARGFSSKEVASQMHVSVNTVLTHSKSIFRKLGVRKRQSAIKKAESLGYL